MATITVAPTTTPYNGIAGFVVFTVIGNQALASTGVTSPVTADAWTITGTFNGQFYYTGTSTGLICWFNSSTNQWIISSVLGTNGTNFWQAPVGSLINAVFFPKGSATGNSTVAIHNFFNNLPSIIVTGGSGSLGGLTAINANQVYGQLTPSAANQTIMFTDTTDGSCTCTLAVPALSLACNPQAGPVSGTLASYPIIFTCYGAGWSAGAGLPSISPSAGSLSALTFISANQVGGVFTPPSTTQAVTFTDSTNSLTCTIAVNSNINVYTYTLGDLAGISGNSWAAPSNLFYGRLSSNYRWNTSTILLFGLSAPFSTIQFSNLSGASSGNNWSVSSSGNLQAPSWVFNNIAFTSTGTKCPLFGAAAESQYQIYCTTGGGGAGWATATTTTVAITVFSTAGSKPNLQLYTNTWLDGTTETLPGMPASYNADGSQAFIGNNQVSPPVLSGAFAQYGFTDLVSDAAWNGSPDGTPPVPGIGYNEIATFSNSLNSRVRFLAKASSIYVIGVSVSPLYSPHVIGSGNGVLGAYHVDIDGLTPVDVFSLTPAPSSSTTMQMIPVAKGLDVSNIHEYTVYGGWQGHLDRVLLGTGSTFAKTPPQPRLAGWITGASHDQGGICWECQGSQSYGLGQCLAKLTGIDLINNSIQGNKIANNVTNLAGSLAAMPVLANGMIGTGGSGATATCTVSGGAVATITITAGGTNYPGSVATLYFASGLAAPGTGAYATAVVSGGVVQNTVTILSGGTGYTSAPAVVVGGGGNGVLNRGVPDFLITPDIGVNDQGTTVRATARQSYLQFLLQWLTTCSGPVQVTLTPISGNPWVTPTGVYATDWSNYDLVGPGMVIPTLLAAYPQFGPLNQSGGRIWLTDQSTFAFNSVINNCGGNTPYTGTITSPPLQLFGGHFSNFGEWSYAQAILPDLLRMLGSIIGGSID